MKIDIISILCIYPAILVNIIFLKEMFMKKEVVACTCNCDIKKAEISKFLILTRFPG